MMPCARDVGEGVVVEVDEGVGEDVGTCEDVGEGVNVDVGEGTVVGKDKGGVGGGEDVSEGVGEGEAADEGACVRDPEVLQQVQQWTCFTSTPHMSPDFVVVTISKA